jgi:hypothetical protein
MVSTPGAHGHVRIRLALDEGLPVHFAMAMPAEGLRAFRNAVAAQYPTEVVARMLRL